MTLGRAPSQEERAFWTNVTPRGRGPAKSSLVYIGKLHMHEEVLRLLDGLRAVRPCTGAHVKASHHGCEAACITESATRAVSARARVSRAPCQWDIAIASFPTVSAQHSGVCTGSMALLVHSQVRYCTASVLLTERTSI